MNPSPSVPTVAVLGTGSIGSRHLEVLRCSGQAPIAVPIRAERRNQWEAQGIACAASLEEAHRMGAEAAVIATDTSRHPEDATEALALGMTVLCEKPLASSISAAAGLASLSPAEGDRVFLACCMRFDEGLQAFKARLEEIGALHAASIECRSYLPDWRPDRDYRQSYSARAAEGGVLLDLIHEIDYALWLFGRPATVDGTAVNTGRLGIATEELALGRWSAPGAAGVAIGLDYLTRVPRRRIEAHGSEGSLDYDFIGGELRLMAPGQPVQTWCFPRDRQHLYLRQMECFLRAVDGGDPGDLATLEDGLAALAVVEAWKSSAANGRKEEVSA